MDDARKWRLRAERYRDFAALACDSEAQQTRLYRARHFDRLADEIEGRTATAVEPPDRRVFPFKPLDAVRRAFARLAAVAS